MVGFDDPAKGGDHIKPVITSEDIDLIVVWNVKRKDGVPAIANEKDEYGYAEIMGFITLLPKIQQAQEFILNIENESFLRWRYVKEDEPQPLGLFNKRYFLGRLRRAG